MPAFAALCFSLDLLSIAQTRQGYPMASFWPTDGILLAVLLCNRRRVENAYLAAGAFIVNVTASRLTGHSLPLSSLYATCNLFDVSLAFLALGPLGRAPDLLRFGAVRRLLVGVVLGPLIAAVVAGVATGSSRVAGVWFSSHALGLAVMTPIMIDAVRGRIGVTIRRAVRRPAVLPTLIFLLSLAVVFGQHRYPLLFLVIVPLLAVASHLGPTAATTAVLPLALAAGTSTALGGGPFGLNPDVRYDERIVLVQVFLLAVLGSVRTVGWITRERDRLDADREGERARLAAGEERYRLLADNATDVVSRVDTNGRTVYVSPACFHVYGVLAADIIERDALEIIHPDDRARIAGIHGLIATGTEDARVEYRVIRRDGRVIWMEASLRALRHRITGEPDGFVSIARDVTERHDLEIERAARERALQFANVQLERLMRHLARARDEAEHANRAKSSFLANMSHELRTPLNGLLGHNEMLRLEGGLTPMQATRVEAMLSAGSHLLSMINAVLDLSTIEADRMECRSAVVDLPAEISSCVDLMRAAAEARALTLRCGDVAGMPSRVIADPTRLRQVLLNLIGNAVKFTVEGGVTISVDRATDSRVRISIADTGPGIDPPQRGRLFEQFDRLDIESRTSIEGAGLGLSLSARLVELMTGTIGHENNPGGGSLFWIELPAAADDGAAGGGDPCEATAIAPPPDGQSRSLRVLGVDDVATNREIACAFVRSGGHEAAAVGGGEAAIELLARQPFDVVLMDARMPGMDGFEATRRIRALDHPAREVPIVALTALAFADQIEACHDAGMDGHLSKPIRRDALLDALSVQRPRGRVPRDREGGQRTPDRAEEFEPVFDPFEFDRVVSFLEPDAVRSCLDALVTRTVGLRAGLDAAADQRSLVEEAHALAGSAGTFGFSRVASKARLFEQAARDPSVGASMARRDLERALEATEPELRRLVATPAGPTA